jgi:hypothetical protein
VDSQSSWCSGFRDGFWTEADEADGRVLDEAPLQHAIPSLARDTAAGAPAAAINAWANYYGLGSYLGLHPHHMCDTRHVTPVTLLCVRLSAPALSVFLNTPFTGADLCSGILDFDKCCTAKLGEPADVTRNNVGGSTYLPGRQGGSSFGRSTRVKAVASLTSDAIAGRRMDLN